MSSLSTRSLVQQSNCRTSKWKHPPLAEHQLITSTKLFYLNGSKNNQLHSKYIPLRHIKAFLPCRSAPKESPGLPPAAYPQDTSQHITDLFHSKLWCTQLHIYIFFNVCQCYSAMLPPRSWSDSSSSSLYLPKSAAAARIKDQQPHPISMPAFRR